MEPDICVIIRHAMALSVDCQEMYGWDFAETYRALMHYAASDRPRGSSHWADFISGVDAGDLELPEDEG